MKTRSIASSASPLSFVLLAASLCLPACSGDDDAPADPVSAAGDETPSETDETAETTDTDGVAPPTPSSATCERGTLEADLQAAPLAGVAVDGGGLRAGDYIISSTYIQLKPDARETFDELLQPVLGDLQTRDGLLALALGQSEACGALRTLAVWRDDTAMIAFVTSPAHSAAMARVTEVSRGGSVVTHWLGDAASASWPVAAEQLAATEGPLY